MLLQARLNFCHTTNSPMALTTTLGRNSSTVNSCEQYVIGYALLLRKRCLSIYKWQSWLVRNLQGARWGCIEETVKAFQKRHVDGEWVWTKSVRICVLHYCLPVSIQPRGGP